MAKPLGTLGDNNREGVRSLHVYGISVDVGTLSRRCCGDMQDTTFVLIDEIDSTALPRIRVPLNWDNVLLKKIITCSPR